MATLVSMAIVAGVLAIIGRSAVHARAWSTLAMISVAAMPVAIVLHNLVGALIGTEEAVFFVVALVVAPIGFAVGTLGAGLVVVRDDRRHRATGTSLLVAGSGLALFGLYAVFALVVTTLEGGNAPYQAAVEAVVMPPAVLALAGGAVAAALSMLVARA